VPFELGDSDQECEWVTAVELVSSISRLAYAKTCEGVCQVFGSLAGS
jgi:hypothetical protein